MSAIPLLIIQFIFYQIQPLFCCCIYCALINSMDHCFNRTIFIGAGMRKDGIYFPIYFGKQRCTRGYKRYKETSGLIEWKECQIFHSIFT